MLRSKTLQLDVHEALTAELLKDEGQRREVRVHHQRLDCFGTAIDLLTSDQLREEIGGWIQSNATGRFIRFANVHMVVEARRDSLLCEAGERASLSLPDGMPIVWLARSRGFSAVRVSGPDFMLEFCERTGQQQYRHFFYGGAPGIAESLAAGLKQRIPDLQIAGTCSPPFHELTPEEDDALVRVIRDTAPDVVWVGLGCPKQEIWMLRHFEKLNVPVLLGVGQAFDIHAGKLKRAPKWMQRCGLEWLFRLASEPKRLWRRYLISNSHFICLVAGAFWKRLTVVRRSI